MNWLGENQEIYRNILKCLNRYASIYNRPSNVSGYQVSGIDLQTLECLFDNEKEKKNMAGIASELGLPTSTFTKIIAKLAKQGLVSKFRRQDNKKDVIVVLTEQGKSFITQCFHNTTDWIRDLKSLIEEDPKRAKYYDELLVFFINWMNKGEEIMNGNDNGERLIPLKE